MLDRDPAKRPSASECLQHPFLQTRKDKQAEEKLAIEEPMPASPSLPFRIEDFPATPRMNKLKSL